MKINGIIVARAEMLESPADISGRRFWIYFDNLGDCYPLLETEISGMLMCVTRTSSLRVLSA